MRHTLRAAVLTLAVVAASAGLARAQVTLNLGNPAYGTSPSITFGNPGYANYPGYASGYGPYGTGYSPYATGYSPYNGTSTVTTYQRFYSAPGISSYAVPAPAYSAYSAYSTYGYGASPYRYAPGSYYAPRTYGYQSTGYRFGSVIVRP